MKRKTPDKHALQGEDETLDELFGGRLRILQKKTGYRFSIDAVLLTGFVKLKRGEAVVDLGTGSGVIAIILALRFPKCGRILGLELQGQLADMARRSVEVNGLGERIEILQGDVREAGKRLTAKSFDVAVFNPPYRKAGSGRTNPDEERALARHEIGGGATDFLSASAGLLKDGGRVYLIYPAKRMVEIIHRMRALKLEPKKLRVVHSKAFSEGDFVLVEGLKGGGEELKVLTPLYIYGEKGGVQRGGEEHLQRSFVSLVFFSLIFSLVMTRFSMSRSSSSPTVVRLEAISFLSSSVRDRASRSGTGLSSLFLSAGRGGISPMTKRMSRTASPPWSRFIFSMISFFMY